MGKSPDSTVFDWWADVDAAVAAMTPTEAACLFAFIEGQKLRDIAAEFGLTVLETAEIVASGLRCARKVCGD